MTSIKKILSTIQRQLPATSLYSMAQYGIDRFVVRNQVVNNAVLRRCIRRDNLRAHSKQFIEFNGPEQVQFDLPNCTATPPENFLSYVGTHTLPKPFVCELTDMTLVGPDAITLTSDGQYVIENTMCGLNRMTHSLFNTMRARLRQGSFTNRPSIDHAVSLVGPWATNYFHWFSDYLPRLIGLEVYEQTIDSRPMILYPPDPPVWILESLELLGYDSNRLEEWHGDRMQVNSLVVPSIRRTQWVDDVEHGVYSCSARKWTRERIIENVSSKDDWPSHIFIARTDAETRRVHNDTDVMEVLEEFGFHRFVLSDLTLQEQVSLFKQAESVVAPHGAGLTNILWSSNLDVIELFGSKQNVSYFRMSNCLDHNYAVIQGKEVGDDMWIDPNELQLTVKCMLNP